MAFKILTSWLAIFFLTSAFAQPSPDISNVGKVGQVLTVNKGTPVWTTPAFVSIQAYGAIGDGKKDDTTAIQSALDAGGLIVLPRGVYKTTAPLVIRSHNTALIGQGPFITSLSYQGTGPAITSDAQGKTIDWCRLAGIRIEATNKNQSGPLVNWTSMQFGAMEDLWIMGNGNPKTIGILLTAIPGQTEASYNRITHSYIGKVQTGMQFGQGANSNTVETSRIQPLPNGVGIYLQGKLSNNRIINTGFEYPGTVSGGILIDGDVHNTFIEGNRFEGLAFGWKVNGSSNSGTIVLGNYYSSIPKGANWIDTGKGTQNFDQEAEEPAKKT